MAINNNICENCKKSGICKWGDKIAVFSKDVKNPLGVDITVNSCTEFDEVE